ncbi:ABC transporter ATP-binding protein [Methanobrevibacter sp.]|uniref:ABC transporter ATP-binding protein n=1 Tax=Methanobrevibacter sp. TaxID=66852 RepID=UPI003890DB43
MNALISPIIKKYKTIILILILLIIQAYFTLTLPEYTADIVNVGVANADMDYVYDIGMKMITTTVLATVSAILVAFFSSRFSSGYARDLRKMIFPKVLKFSNHELNDISKSSLITRILIDVSQIQMFAEELLTVIIFAPIIGVGGIMKSLELGTNLSWIILLIFAIVIIFMIPIFMKVLPYLGKLQEITDRINVNTREVLTGMPVIKTFVRQDYEEKKFDKVNSEFNETNIRAYRYILLLTPLLTLHLSLMTVGIIYFGSFQIEAGDMLIGDLLAFIQYATQIVTSFLMVATFFTIMPDIIVSIRRVNEIFKTEVSITDGEIDTINTDKPIIEFKNVDFKYPNSENNTLTDINLKLEPGKTIAIIGGIGSGKSTILNLIPRLQDPTAGEILLNGENIKKYKLSTLRENISFTPQKAHIFEGTVKSNMTIIDENASDDEINEALKRANVNFIDGLDDEVAPGGANFSGGQKQRLSIARSILKECDFYLFDDCFSALDMNTERIIKNNLKEMEGSSILIVSQRISTIKDADEIIVLDNGKILDRGPHDRLVETCGIYREIVDSQVDALRDAV